MPTYARYPVEFVRGEGARLWDDDGNEYLDFLAGISVSSVGHCHPRVVEAIREQAGELIHVGNLFYTEPWMRLAERLAESSLGGKRVLHQLRRRGHRGGAQARPQGEAGRRDRRRCTARFHGRTYGALSATPQESKQAPFAPLVPGLRRRRADRRGASPPRSTSGPRPCCSSRSRARAASAPLPDELLRAAREACDAHGAALIFDEIQCGLGRTGTLWAYEQAGVVPDALTTAKALGGGLPIGALVTGERLADVLEPGDHGSTFAGGPVVPPPRTRRSTSSTTRRCSRACASSASGSRRGSPSCRACATCAGAA